MRGKERERKDRRASLTFRDKPDWLGSPAPGEVSNFPPGVEATGKKTFT